jgi:hypothetical protein
MDAMEWLRQWEESPQVRDLVKQLSVLTNDFQAAHAVDDERFVLKAAGAFFVHVAVATATQHGIPTDVIDQIGCKPSPARSRTAKPYTREIGAQTPERHSQD